LEGAPQNPTALVDEQLEQAVNHFELYAKLVSKSVLRYTPAGLAVCDCELEHESIQLEASKPRKVFCTVQALAMGNAAIAVNGFALGQTKVWSGFIALRSHKQKGLQFHICALRNN
jgi:primosomal replication protein N